MKLWEAAKVYVDAKVPWRDRGRSMDGVDCIGLVICSCRDVGVDIDPADVLHRNMEIGEVIRTLVRYCVRVPTSQMAPGDIVCFGEKRASMIGIISPGRPFNVIHAPFSAPVVEVKFGNFGLLRGLARLKEAN